jgi:hypothetical protein
MKVGMVTGAARLRRAIGVSKRARTNQRDRDMRESYV